MKPRLDCLRVVCWRLTRRCNRACVFCLSTSGPRFADPVHDPYAIMKRLVEMGVEKISYSGGEPLLYPNLPTLVDHGERLGVAQALTTNGDLLQGQIPAWFRLLEHVKLSFYGPREGHDHLMGGGHYDLQLSLARRLQVEGHVSVSANYMLSAVTGDGVEGFLADSSAAGFYHVVFQTYIPNRRKRIDNMYTLHSHAAAITAVNQVARRFAGDFPGGIRVHDFSRNDWLIVLNEHGQLTLPSNHPVEPDHVMGGVFDDALTGPSGHVLPAADAVALVWSIHADTDAVVNLDRGKWSRPAAWPA